MIKFWFDNFKHKRASHRIRALRPVEGLKSLGVDADIVNLRTINQITTDDIVIVTKDSGLEVIPMLQQQGYTVGFDLCDNKFKEEGERYQQYCKIADFVTCNTEFMQQEVKQATGLDSYVFVDSVERPQQTHRQTDCQPVRLVWYGGAASLKYVDFGHCIQLLNRSKIDYELTILVDNAEQRIGHLSKLGNVRCVDWSYDTQEQIVSESDIVFIPMFKNNQRRTRTKSPNRVLDGIAQGRWVIAGNVPSYQQVKEFCWLGDPVEGIQHYINKPLDVARRIKAGQRWIQNNASPEAVARQLIDIHTKVKHG